MCNKLEKKDYNKIFYTPRTITTGCVILVMINFCAFYWADALRESTKEYYRDPENPDVFEHFRWPIFFAFLSLVGFAMTHFPDTLIKRPHPAFWRIVLGLLASYCLFMTFVLILPLKDARYIFKIFHPS